MADMNSFNFTGRLTNNASTRTLAGGKDITNADVAINTGYGEQKKVLYVKLQLWGERGKKLVNYLTKGTLVAVTGELQRSEWSNKEGKTYVDIIVFVKDIQLLGNKKKDEQGSTTVEVDEPVY